MQTTTGSVLNICIENPSAQAIDVRVIKVGNLSPHLLEFETFDYTFLAGESQYCFDLPVYNVFEEKDYTLKLRTRQASDLGEYPQLTIQVAGFNQGGDLFTDCDCDEGNLFPLGDFDDPILGENTSNNGFFGAFGLEQCDPLVQINQNSSANSPGWSNPLDEGGNKIAYLAGTIKATGTPSNPEVIYFPLCRTINPGCEATVSLRYRLGTFPSGTPFPFEGGGNIQIIGTNATPCSQGLVQMLNCGDEIAGAACLTPNTNSSGLIGIAVTENDWMTTTVNWVNDTDFPVNYITIANNTLGFEVSSDVILRGNTIYIDDIVVTSQCDNNVTLAAEPAVELCAGFVTDVPIELCVSGPGPAPTAVNVQVTMPDPFTSVVNGTLIAPQIFEVPITGWVFNESCAEAVIAVNVPGAYPLGSGVGPITVVAIGENACSDDELNIDFIITNGDGNAGFSSNPVDCDQQFYAIQFSPFTSFGPEHFWEFDYGNGTIVTNTQTSPTHIFPGPGTYEVTHTITTDCGEQSVINTVTVAECIPPAICGSCDFTLVLSDDGILLSDIINDAPFNGSYDLDLSGQCLSISGQLIVDQDFTVTGGEIQMQPGSEIVLDQGLNLATMTLNNVNENGGIHGCDQMWKGIRVIGNLNLIVDHTIIQDAQHAIWQQNKTTITVNHSDFYNNYIGLHLADNDEETPQFFVNSIIGNTFTQHNGGLKVPFAGQTPLPNSQPYAGILIFNSSLLIQVGTALPDPLGLAGLANKFINLSNGIISFNTPLNVYQNHFTNVRASPEGLYFPRGFGILHSGNPGKALITRNSRFTNCDDAIYSYGSDHRSFSNEMINVGNGITVRGAQNKRIDIANNPVIQARRRGIALLFNDPSASILVNNNTVTVLDAGEQRPVAIDVQESGNSHDTNPYISNNVVLMRAPNSMGINLNYTSCYRVESNTVRVFEAGDGVRLSACLSSDVFDNRIIGVGTDRGTGISMNNGVNDNYRCNLLQNLQTGMYVSGDFTGDKLRRNIFRPPFTDGLHYAQNTTMGAQEDGENEWESGLYLGAAARNDILNSGDITGDLFEMRYEVNTGVSPTYRPASFAFPNIPLVPTSTLADLWFEPSTSLAVLGCEPLASNAEDDLADDLSAAQWWQKLRGSDPLAACVGGLAINPFLPTNSQWGDLRDLESDKKQLFNADTLRVAKQRQFGDELLDLLGELYDWEEAGDQQVDYVAVRQSLLDQINERISIAYQLEVGIVAAKLAAITSMKVENEEISVQELPFQNQQALNAIYLASIAQDENVDNEMANQLLTIAEQCPLEGGDAVYWARSMYHAVDENYLFNSDYCAGTDGLRSAFGSAQATVESDEIISLKAYPNPVSGQLTIELPLAFSGQLKLLDSYGRVLRQQQMRESNEHLSWDMKNLRNGLYYLLLIDVDGQQIASQRITVLP